MTNSSIQERNDRLAKLEKISNPYPSRAKRSHKIAEVLESFSKLEADKTLISLTGRVMSFRSHGNLSFLNLKDSSGEIQVALTKNDLGAEEYKSFLKIIDVADFLELSGTCFVTHKGQNSLLATNYKILSKALLPLPEKWHGLKDEEEKLRKRYLDLLLNDELHQLFIKKAKFWQVVRDFMNKHGFLEVETPVLETTTGGAEARPFKTYHNDFDLDVFKVNGRYKIPLREGKISFIRWIDKSCSIDIFSEKFQVSEDLKYHYVKATIFTKENVLLVTHGDEVVQEIPYSLMD